MSLLLKGVTKLSELIIDANKDWAIKGIDSLSYVIIEDGAGHYFRLPSLTTAQRDGLTPAAGMTIWNSTTTQVERYNGSDWGSMGIAGVTVRKNTMMPVIGNRPQLNLIEGAAVGIQIADNPPDDEIDVTISAKYPTRFMTLIPEDASLPTSNPAAKATVDGTNFAYDVLDFDPGTEESANWEWFLTPDYLSENIVVDIFWESAGAGDAKFGFSTLGREKGEDWDAALGTEQTVVTTNLGAGKMNKSRIATFAPGWSPGDALLFKLARKAGDAADTIDANDVRVLKVVVSYTGQFAQAFYPLAEPVELTLDTSGSWKDMDVSAYIPAGATGVILHIEKIGANERFIGLRKKGSTDDRHDRMFPDSHLWAMTGVDENRIFQYYVEAFPEAKIWLVGYTATGVVFFDNAYEKVPGGFDSWQDIDVSAECPGAIGVIVELVAPNAEAAVRQNGSGDDWLSMMVDKHIWAITGCDGSQIFETLLYDASAHLYIIGYVTQGAVFKTNIVDKTPGTIDTWIETDCSADAPSAVMIFFLAEMWGGNSYGARKHGSTEDITRDAVSYRAYAFVACDSGQKVDLYSHALYMADYVTLGIIGYATWAGA